jgi:hypothetical protein
MFRNSHSRLLVTASAFVLAAGVACGGDDEPAATESPAPIESSEEASAPVTPEESTPSDTTEVDVEAQAEEISACLEDGGMESEIESGGISTWGEKATIGVTFKYESIAATVPDAVSLLLFASPEKAAKVQPEIDENLLEGDTPTQLFGNVIVDDFGTTMEEPEAEEQANIVLGCVGG